MTSGADAPKVETTEAVGFETHDHAGCIASAIAVAEEHCASEGLRFTPVRRQALEILLQEHRAIVRGAHRPWFSLLLIRPST